MKFKKIINNDLIDKPELARNLWPNVLNGKTRAQMWYEKIKGVKGRKFSEEEQLRIEAIYRQFFGRKKTKTI